MSSANINEKGDIRFLLRAVAAWAISALALLLIASLVVSKASTSSGSIGYISSAMSFIASVFAGASAVRERQSGALYTGLITAATITVLLLTIGFIIRGTDMESAGILSVVTFTFSGCLIGGVFFGGKKLKTKKSNFQRMKKRS